MHGVIWSECPEETDTTSCSYQNSEGFINGHFPQQIMQTAIPLEPCLVKTTVPSCYRNYVFLLFVSHDFRLQIN